LACLQIYRECLAGIGKQLAWYQVCKPIFSPLPASGKIIRSPWRPRRPGRQGERSSFCPWPQPELIWVGASDVLTPQLLMASHLHCAPRALLLLLIGSVLLTDFVCSLSVALLSVNLAYAHLSRAVTRTADVVQ
jgi:hypothetical protein